MNRSLPIRASRKQGNAVNLMRYTRETSTQLPRVPAALASAARGKKARLKLLPINALGTRNKRLPSENCPAVATEKKAESKVAGRCWETELRKVAPTLYFGNRQYRLIAANTGCHERPVNNVCE